MKTTLIRLVVTAVVSATVLTGCGGESSARTDGTSTSSSDNGDSDNGGSDIGTKGLPDGFPEDLPLPEYKDVIQAGSGISAGKSWQLVFSTAPSETVVADYAAMLEDAGYTVADAPGESKEARGSKWVVNFHSTSSRTLTVMVRAIQ